MQEYLDLIYASAKPLCFVFTFLFGIVVGSFLNVCIYRIPEKQTIVTVPSHCMTCGKKLHWYELIPLFSWLFLRGKCHGCKAKISVQYPLVECANGLIWILVLFVKGLCPEGLLCCALFSALFVIAVIDARTQIIPQGLIIFCLVVSVLECALRIFYYHDKWYMMLLGSVVLGGIFFLIWFFSEGKALGYGDVKLMLACGLFLGLKGSLCGVVITCFAGSIIHLSLMAIKKVGRRLALGPYLALGYAAAALWGNELINWYLDKFFNI